MEHRDSGFIDRKIKSILQAFNLIGEGPIGTGDLRIWFASVSNKNLAKQVIQKKLKENEGTLNNLIQEYGDKAFIIARRTKRSTTERYLGGYLKLDVVPPPKELYPYKGPQTYDEITTSILYSRRDPVKIVERVCSNVSPKDLITSYCYFLTYSSLYDSAVKFFQGLRPLAVKIPTYNSYGVWLWDEYSVSAEVADWIMSRVKKPNLDEFAERFGVLATIVRLSEIRYALDGGRALNDLLRTFEIRQEKIEEELNTLNARGITSRLIREPGAAPFTVLEPEEAVYQSIIRSDT